MYDVEDFASRMAGRTQNETSAAWCGPTVAIGWNNSGSLVSTAFLGQSGLGNLSFLGWARSTDPGRTYVDRGMLFARTCRQSWRTVTSSVTRCSGARAGHATRGCWRTRATVGA